MSRCQRARRQVGLCPGSASGTQKLRRIGSQREVDGRGTAIEKLYEIISERRASETAARINLTDHQSSDVVVLDSGEALCVADGRAIGGVGQIDEEGLIQLDQHVAVDGDVDRLAGITRIERECASGRLIIISHSRRSAIGSCEIYSHYLTARRRQSDVKGGNGRAAVTFREADIIND